MPSKNKQLSSLSEAKILPMIKATDKESHIFDVESFNKSSLNPSFLFYAKNKLKRLIPYLNKSSSFRDHPFVDSTYAAIYGLDNSQWVKQRMILDTHYFRIIKN